MCIGIPAKLEAVCGQNGIAAIGDAKIEVNLVLLDGVSAGDYVLVHAGFAIAKVDPEEARGTLDLVKEMITGEIS